MTKPSSKLNNRVALGFPLKAGTAEGYLLSALDIFVEYAEKDLETILNELKNYGKVKSVNGNQPDSNGNVSITIPSIAGLASESWVNSQGFLKEHQSLLEYYKKTEIDSFLEGKATTTSVANLEELLEQEISRAKNREDEIEALIPVTDTRMLRDAIVNVSGNKVAKLSTETYIDLYYNITGNSVIYIDTEGTPVDTVFTMRVRNPSSYSYKVRSGNTTDWNEIRCLTHALTLGENGVLFTFKVCNKGRLQLLSITEYPATEQVMEGIFDDTFDNSFD